MIEAPASTWYDQEERGQEMEKVEGSQARAVTIELSPEVEHTVRRRAAEQGRPVADYLREVIERSVMTFDEILAPVREGFEQSGLSDDELDRLFTEAREEVWQEKQKGRP
jgi:predicted DNA-binding protein